MKALRQVGGWMAGLLLLLAEPAAAAITHGQVVSALSAVATRCAQGQLGYRTAAENVNSMDLRTMFQRHAQRRADFFSELQQQLARLGATVDNTPATPSERGWLTPAEAAAKNDRLVVQQVIRGEEATLQTYADALQTDLPPEVRNVLRRQEAEIERQLGTVKARREAQEP